MIKLKSRVRQVEATIIIIRKEKCFNLEVKCLSSATLQLCSVIHSNSIAIRSHLLALLEDDGFNTSDRKYPVRGGHFL